MINKQGSGTVRLVISGAVGVIQIDNLERLNALTKDMWAEIPGKVRAAEDNAEVRVIVVRGAGDNAFSAGADISEFESVRTGPAAEDYNRLNHEAFVALEGCGKPTVALIHGFCLGGGLGLAMSCDLRFCDEAARFAIPAARLGIGYHPRWLRPILAAVSGPHAKELLFTGARFDAAWALRTGLVNDVVAASALDGRVQDVCDLIGANAPLSIRAAKRSIDVLCAEPGLRDERELVALIDACFASDDYREGCKAFSEKRRPVFKGR